MKKQVRKKKTPNIEAIKTRLLMEAMVAVGEGSSNIPVPEEMFHEIMDYLKARFSAPGMG